MGRSRFLSQQFIGVRSDSFVSNSVAALPLRRWMMYACARAFVGLTVQESSAQVLLGPLAPSQ